MVCRELGYIGALSATSNSHFGYVSSTFSYGDVFCTGSETSLDDCRHNDYDNCDQYEGAGVICNTSPPMAGKHLHCADELEKVNVLNEKK